MNKKFLSAILFGALMVTSTGTFVSCKDYDDDIKGLQTQIDTNKTAIAELQKLVGSGNWVTNVAASGENLVVTMSNGTTATIAGIKGADGKDGKNAAEWTIGEDGFWYVNGEKTTNVAVAQNGKDGKNGVSAPSPFIGTDGNWVVYSWDATKGEFVQEATEISAQGTSAYAVKANGIYTLFIADENGEMQEIALPATSDSFVVSALSANLTTVKFESAKWTPSISNKYYKEIVKAFPEIADIEKKSLIKQGGNLPVLVNPANVELTNEFNFSLQTIKGEVLDIEVSNPQKGLIGDYVLDNGNITSRTAKAEDCLWTLNINPAYDEETKGYVKTVSGKPAALVVENAKGTIVKTAFAYVVDADDLTSEEKNVTINEVSGYSVTGNLKTSTAKVSYAEAIDLFAEDSKTKETPVVLANEYVGYYIIELADELEIEKLGLSIAEDGHTLKIASMPAGSLSENVTLNVVALGLNGSVAQNTVTLTITREITASTGWDEKVVTLKATSKGVYTQNVLWDITDLGFTATQKKQLLDNKAHATIEVSYIDEDGQKQIVDANGSDAGKEYPMLFKKANGTANAGSNDYSTWTYAGFTLNAKDYKEGEYTALIKITDGTSLIYSAEATIIVKNPELGAAYVKLVPGFVDENGVYQITGTPTTTTATATQPAGVVTYTLENALILGDGAAVKNIIDLDNVEYVEEGRDDEALEMTSWITPNAVAPAIPTSWTLSVNQWAKKQSGLTPAWRSDIYNQLYETRKVRAEIMLFGNPDNVVPFDFEVEVKSELYSADPVTDKVVTFGTMEIEFGAKDNTAASAPAGVDESVIDIKAAITKVVAMAGTDKGKAYDLFAKKGAEYTDGATNAVTNYLLPQTVGEDKILVKDKNYVEAPKNTDMLLFGFTEAELNDALSTTPSKKYYLTINHWRNIWYVVASYYHHDGTMKKAGGKNVEVLPEHKPYTDLFVAYKTLIDFTITDEGDEGTTKYKEAVESDPRVDEVTIAFADPDVAKNYFDFTYTNKDFYANTDVAVDADGVIFTDDTNAKVQDICIKPKAEAPNSVTGGQVKVGLILTIKDAWGMTMEIPFEVTVKTAK